MYFDRFDILQAYWLFGAEYHTGQGSKEYAYIGRAEKLGFSPGLMLTYKSLTDNGKEIYDNLVSRISSL